MLVKEWMSHPVITVDENNSMQTATALLKQHKIRMLPVMKNNKLTGIITDRDLKKASASDATTLEIHELLYILTKIKVADIMTKDPITVPDDYTIEELITLLDLLQQDADAQLYPTAQAPDEADIQIPGRIVPGAEQPPVAAPADRLSVESALQRVVVHAFEEFSNLRTPMIRSTNRVGHRRIARALDYIRSLDPGINPAAVTLDELAGIAGLSKFHFLRQFSQVVGITPGAYLRTLRLCHAARMLRTTDRPILDIALSVGFADHPSFSRAFARHMGMTPSEYQKLGPL